MAKKIVTWTCEICGESFGSEKECVAHEATHSIEIPCVHVSARGETECTCAARVEDNVTNLAFTWQRGTRKVTQHFKIQGYEIRPIDAAPEPMVDMTNEGEMVDNGHIADA